MHLGQTTRLVAVGSLGRKVHSESVVFGRIGSGGGAMGWLGLNRSLRDPTVFADALGASPSKGFWLRWNARFWERKRELCRGRVGSS